MHNGVKVMESGDFFYFDKRRRDDWLCCGGLDVVLSPHDLFRLSRQRGADPIDFFLDYCLAYVDGTPGVPAVFLRFGEDGTCPLRRAYDCCEAGDDRPEACKLFPLNRYARRGENGEIAGVRYFADEQLLGGKDKQNVGWWVSACGIAEDEAAYFGWIRANGHIARAMARLSEAEDLNAVYRNIYKILYTNYRTDEPFMPQFSANMEQLTAYLDSL